MNRRGSVLIGVIWAVAMLGIFMVAISHRASQELEFGRWMYSRVAGRAAANSGIQIALAVIQADKTPNSDDLKEPWASNPDIFKEIRQDVATFTLQCEPEEGIETKRYGVCDESSRININYANEETLKGLIHAVDEKMDEKQAVIIAESIMDWRDEDDAQMTQGAEATFYQSQQLPYKPRNAPFESAEEIMMIRGVDRALYEKLKPFITVYTAGPVNFNTASAVAFEALGASRELALKILEYRLGPDRAEGTEDDGVVTEVQQITPTLSANMSFSPEEFKQLANAISQGFILVKSDVFRIRSIGRLISDGTKPPTITTAVVDREGSILYWKEGD